jgi:hypothetical protein
MPNNIQAQVCLRLCQALSSMFQPIHLLRYDPRRKTVYILAGMTEGIELIIDSYGEWDFTS